MNCLSPGSRRASVGNHGTRAKKSCSGTTKPSFLSLAFFRATFISGLGMLALLTILVKDSTAVQRARRALVDIQRRDFGVRVRSATQAQESLTATSLGSQGTTSADEARQTTGLSNGADSFLVKSQGSDEGIEAQLIHVNAAIRKKAKTQGKTRDAAELELNGAVLGLDDRETEVGSSLGEDGVDEVTGVVDRMDDIPVSKKKRDKKTKKPPRSRRNDCPLEYNESMVPQSLPDLAPPAFSLAYVSSEHGSADTAKGQGFAGTQTWQQREASFHIDEGLDSAGRKLVHCGFVDPRGEATPSLPGDLFTVSQADKDFLSGCRIAVVSAVFGNFDEVHLPQRSKMSASAKQNVCFALFLDSSTLRGMQNDSLQVKDGRYVGLWRLVLVNKLPYTDNRVNGKIPKMLSHRLLPNARYSMWVDSKLRLYADPLYALHQFLVKPGAEFAISQHYDRNCVWQEVARNKFLKKFNETILDQQLDTYKQDGLRPFNPKDPDQLLPSNVPEGSFFMRAHTPMSNLFSCLWFNEVNRFSSRDQIGFAYVFYKLVRSNPGWSKLKINMFRDCDKRAMVKLFHHREEARLLALRRLPPP